MSFASETRLVMADRHARLHEDPTVTPIYLATTYVSESLEALDQVMAESRPGYAYSRQGNPTVAALEAALTDVEGGQFGWVTASGMAAIQLALETLQIQPGDTLLVAWEIYGATELLLREWAKSRAVRIERVPACDVAAWRAAASAHSPRALYIESSSNPLLRVPDLEALAQVAHEVGALLVVDNTFASPWTVKPLRLGADLVVESLTKYIAGHGDVTAGLVSGRDAEHGLRAKRLRTLTGGTAGPFDAYLALRGLKTLPLRMERQSANAEALARHFVERGLPVFYPGLAGHPDHAVVRRLWQRGFGAMVAIEFPGGREMVGQIFERVKVWHPATSLGDVASLMLYPAVASHRGLTPEERHALGIGDGLIRLSVGIEAVDDLIEDLEQASS